MYTKAMGFIGVNQATSNAFFTTTLQAPRSSSRRNNITHQLPCKQQRQIGRVST